MASLNKVLLIGNLTRDPELRYIPSGSAVTSFTLAVNRVYKLQTGEKKEETSFIRVVVWGRMAEVCSEYLTKGAPVFCRRTASVEKLGRARRAEAQRRRSDRDERAIFKPPGRRQGAGYSG